ncbi:hypothetical protein ACS0TY_000945 [Phlomoides rotata]
MISCNFLANWRSKTACSRWISSSSIQSPLYVQDVSVYLGAAPIVECLERHTPDVLITSRVADASLFLGPMVFELGWNWDDLQLLAQGSLAGHLLECGCQVTGGYYMHPGDRHRKITFQNLLELSLPFVEVAFDGTVCVAKAEGTGGVLDSSTCAEQLLYEIRDPSSYITPDLVKFAELTLDTFRMMQCLEWEPSGSFYQKPPVEPRENGVPADNSVTSGMIDINLLADMTDPNLPPNPKKAVLYRPSVTQLIAVIATVCEELPPESVMLIYLSTTGNSVHSNTSQVENNGLSRKSAMSSALSNIYHEQRNGFCDNHLLLSDSKVLCCGAKPSAESLPKKLLLLRSKDCGWKGWGEISYGGYESVERAKAAEFLIRAWMEELYPGLSTNVTSYIIGLDSLKAMCINNALSKHCEDIRLRMDGLFEKEEHAIQFTKEFTALYTNGPAGGGGICNTLCGFKLLVAIVCGRFGAVWCSLVAVWCCFQPYWDDG